jgi:hypothetical protein
MIARLTATMLASALIRSAEAKGGFAAVLAKGDAQAGAILIITREKGAITGLYERLLALSGGYIWQRAVPQTVDNEGEIAEIVARKRARDPDLWVIELDIPDAERFIAGIDV